ncbi:MAG TPA: septum formation initiator family protein [Kiritimatiellae bacterium]|nr:septum formation initiator family protein [Kiritimatiellia bacterium]
MRGRRKVLGRKRRARTLPGLLSAAPPWRRILYRGVWSLIALLLTVGLFSLFGPQYLQYRSYTRRIRELDAAIEREQTIIKKLQLKQQRLKVDPDFLKRVAHEMGMAEPDEVIFRFVEPEPPESSEASPPTSRRLPQPP